MRVIGEPRGNIPVLPAAAVFERLRQVPVIETNPGFDIGRHDPVDEAVIEFESLFVWATPSLGEDARPSGGQAVGADPEFAHQRHVLRPPVVMVASDVTVVVAENLTGNMAERVPNRRPAPVLGDRALNLISRHRGAPQKIFGKTSCHRAVPEVATTVA